MACDDLAVESRPDRVTEGPIRLAVVDDHPSIGLAIEAAVTAEDAERAATLRVERTIRLVGVARTVPEALRLLAAPADDRPHVILCDAQLQASIDGLDVVDAAAAADVRAIVFTSFDRASLMRAAFDRGAAGFIHKSAEPEAILDAVRRVTSGQSAFPASVLDAVRRSPRPPSVREIEVLRAINRGASSDEIAGQLGISPRTVESHLRRLFDRYGVVSRTELAVLAIREGWVEVGR